MSDDAPSLLDAQALYDSGDLSACASLCEAILGRVPDDAGADHLTGRLAERADNHQLALEYFSRAMESAPTEAAHPFAQAVVLRKLGRDQQAIDAFKSAIRLYQPT